VNPVNGRLADLGLREADEDTLVVSGFSAGRVGCRLVDLDAPPNSGSDHTRTAMTVANEPPVEDSVVRPFVRARGRVTVLEHLELETLVSATTDAPLHDLPTAVDDVRIVAVCRAPRSVAEVVALLGVPLTLVMIMISDAVSRGLLRVHSAKAAAPDGRPSMDVLVRLREGLRRMV
jgi:hypothetical protein